MPAQDSGDASPGEAARQKKSRPRKEPTPAQRALALLVRREHSRRELERKLAARGVEREDARAAVDRMAEAGWQDDGRFAALLARSRAVSGYGPLRIRVELESHGLDAAVIDDAFRALAEAGDDSWLEQACDLVGRRFPVAADEDSDAMWKRRRKAADFLVRRGFDMDTVRRASAYELEE
ncbi:regulatory protein RecX [Luteimonas yindakuii]|uniref:Regulatory protein RecX n=1 Tax=Luteimonas yindakuii TaxID=2565782 RepID=A0A4Z1R6E8_9GAMM|nr:regulatory protein RecX [Luteimonas yindakuii]TKS55234.1 regulatory protein RecX [Luteimonas yindakuii]